MAKSEIRFDGEVLEAKPNAVFDVELDNGNIIIARIAGKLRIHYIRITPGDWVTVEMSPYDLTKARIINRFAEADSKRLSREKINKKRRLQQEAEMRQVEEKENTDNINNES